MKSCLYRCRLSSASTYHPNIFVGEGATEEEQRVGESFAPSLLVHLSRLLSCPARSVSEDVRFGANVIFQMA